LVIDSYFKPNARYNHPKSILTVSTETVRRELHESTIHGRAAIATPLITENNAKSPKRWSYHKTWTSDAWRHI